MMNSADQVQHKDVERKMASRRKHGRYFRTSAEVIQQWRG